MNSLQTILGVLLSLTSAWFLLLIFGFATLSAGGLEDGSPEWWPTVLGGVARTPETYVWFAGLLAGVAFCLHRPGSKMSLGRWLVLIVVSTSLLGLFLRLFVR